MKKAVQCELAVTNAGPDVGNGVVLALRFSGVPLRHAKLPKGCVLSTSESVDCTFGSIATGATIVEAIKVTPTGTGMLTVAATASSTTLDPNPVNQSAPVSVVVQ